MKIMFNHEMKRYEVFGPHSVVRAGKRQPVFVSANLQKAREYIRRAAK